ncbi:MAG: hypothetical protein HYV16_01685 [Gammaproteobacteria bacterium]|nr:hypothetical protein [Gammaproteobacteria bacterium]
MISKLLASVAISLYAFAVPVLEINSSHVFNPDWVAHARLHEVWQLLTNTWLGLYSLWRLWFRRDLDSAVLLSLLVAVSFFFAYELRGIYEGSMVHSDGTERLVLGSNIGVFGFWLTIVLLGTAWCLPRLHGHRGATNAGQRRAPPRGRNS